MPIRAGDRCPLPPERPTLPGHGGEDPGSPRRPATQRSPAANARR